MNNLLALQSHSSYRPFMKVDNEILALLSLAGVGLGEGESTRDFSCPFCSGGSSGEKAFSITKTDGSLLFLCFRASCGAKGGLATNGSLVEPGAPTATPGAAKKDPRAYDGPLEKLLPYQITMLGTRYGFSPQEIEQAGIMFASETLRLAVPVRSPHGARRGYMLRGENSFQPKWQGWQERVNEPWMAWYRRSHSTYTDPVVLVEDQFSALKVSRHFPAVALLGTELSIPKIQELLDYGNHQKRFVLALDRDAYEKSLVHVDKWKFYLEGNLIPVMLSKDFKYEDEGTIIKTISEAYKSGNSD